MRLWHITEDLFYSDCLEALKLNVVVGCACRFSKNCSPVGKVIILYIISTPSHPIHISYGTWKISDLSPNIWAVGLDSLRGASRNPMYSL